MTEPKAPPQPAAPVQAPGGIHSLPGERVGPYLRALQAGLQALAPHEDHVPLREAIAHLQALDPALSGSLLAPAEVDARSGLPGFPWMERALAEQDLAQRGSTYADTPDRDVADALRLDPEMGERVRARRDLHRHLRQHALLPLSRLQVALKRVGQTTDFVLAFDRMTPSGAWMRVRAEVSGRAGWERHGPLSRTPDGRATADQGLQHLLSRHIGTPLLALRAQLGASLGAEITRLSRGFVGPFWFPGLPLPPEVPAPLRQGLLLHLSAEVVSREVRQSSHRDPWLPPSLGEIPPDGHGIYRERRFAGSPNLLAPVREWAALKGIDVVISPLIPR